MRNPLTNRQLKNQIWKYFHEHQLSLLEVTALYKWYIKKPLRK